MAESNVKNAPLKSVKTMKSPLRDSQSKQGNTSQAPK